MAAIFRDDIDEEFYEREHHNAVYTICQLPQVTAAKSISAPGVWIPLKWLRAERSQVPHDHATYPRSMDGSVRQLSD